jgi:hypothetical protein
LDEPIGGADGKDIGSLGDLIVDPLAEGAFEEVLGAMGGGGPPRPSLRALGARALDPAVAVRVAGSRRGIARREVAESLGVSVERVRQLEQRALGKLAAAAGAGEEGRDDDRARASAKTRSSRPTSSAKARSPIFSKEGKGGSTTTITLLE